MKYIVILACGFILGTWFQYNRDAQFVAETFQSENGSLVQDVQEAAGLLDRYEDLLNVQGSRRTK